MAVSDADIEHIRDLFHLVPNITTRKMFGGLGVYSDGIIFAIIGPESTFYIKANERLAADLKEEGSFQFAYEKRSGQTTKMGYWTLPDSAQDDPELAAKWAVK
jgi:DNA transformation protein